MLMYCLLCSCSLSRMNAKEGLHYLLQSLVFGTIPPALWTTFVCNLFSCQDHDIVCQAWTWYPVTLVKNLLTSKCHHMLPILSVLTCQAPPCASITLNCISATVQCPWLYRPEENRAENIWQAQIWFEMGDWVLTQKSNTRTAVHF